MPTVRITVPRLLTHLAVGLILCGCSKQNAGKPDQTYDRLSWIGAAYMQATDHLNRAPANFDELLPYLKERGDAAEIRRSDNDKEEFVFCWGVDYRAYQNEGKPFPVTAYEKTGRKGLRLVLQVRNVSELTSDQLKQAPFPPGARPPD